MHPHPPGIKQFVQARALPLHQGPPWGRPSLYRVVPNSPIEAPLPHTPGTPLELSWIPMFSVPGSSWPASSCSYPHSLQCGIWVHRRMGTTRLRSSRFPAAAWSWRTAASVLAAAVFTWKSIVFRLPLVRMSELQRHSSKAETQPVFCLP